MQSGWESGANPAKSSTAADHSDHVVGDGQVFACWRLASQEQLLLQKWADMALLFRNCLLMFCLVPTLRDYPAHFSKIISQMQVLTRVCIDQLSGRSPCNHWRRYTLLEHRTSRDHWIHDDSCPLTYSRNLRNRMRYLWGAALRTFEAFKWLPGLRKLYWGQLI